MEAEAFQGNRRHLLSAAATRQRREWLAGRSALWSERYGGGWEAVGELIKASRRAALRVWRWIWLLALPVLLAVFITDLYVVDQVFDLAKTPLSIIMGIALAIVALLMLTLIVTLIVSYVRQLVASLRRKPAARTSEQNVGGRIASGRRRAGRRSLIRSWGPRLLLLLSVVLVVYFAAFATIGDALNVSDQVRTFLLRGATIIVVGLGFILVLLIILSYVRQLFGWLLRKRWRASSSAG